MAERTPPTHRRTKAPAVAGGVAVLLGALLLLAAYLLHAERSVAGTPGPRPDFTGSEFTLAPRQRACMTSVTLPPRGRLLQFSVRGAGAHAPRIDVLLSAPGYRSLVRVPASESGEGQAEVPIRPPHHYLIGSVCLINRGNAPALFAGSTEARSRSRSTLTIDGRAVAGDIALTFLESHRRSRLSRLGEAFGHASTLTDRLIPPWLVWVLVAMAAVAASAGSVALFQRAVTEDDLRDPPAGGSPRGPRVQ